ncbi:YcnI family copper-binding membrane protein [Subtercola sp. YIM 133946]|uniref:YcnI family copper-binding membrane protein n=1 Tax=Subtercola sp. YIM 133946 TaxID=3118909 RepID=UPI002F9576CD
MKKKTIARAITAATVTLGLAVGVPLAASAHVPVTPNQATAGSYATLTFKVPTESATASTVKVEIDFPTDTPFGSISYQPISGWTANVVTSTLATPVTTDDGTITEAPTQITFTADGAAAIAPGQFQQFVVSAGPVPDTGSVMFPVHQTYSDGTVADWVDATPASGVEPENPAPTLYITDAPPAEAGAGAAAGAASGSGSASVSATDGAAAGSGGDGSVITQGTATVTSTTSSTEAVALAVGIAGLALGAVALVVAVFAVTRARGRSGAGRSSGE